MGFPNEYNLYIMQYMFLSEGWIYDDEILDQPVEIGTVDQTEINRRKTVTQVCIPKLTSIKDSEIAVCNFGFPFDYQLMCNSCESI